ncbi:hypothetical protein R3P38DRAFT_3108710 [Favolaschia claudopus]|uniref:Uncharacterized protein n=1 Tax=Favolaschia claudopus TaxID=2862362 RepID=A0AAV9ZJ56_9AGAR
MSGYLTFTHQDILNGSLTMPSGEVPYTISTAKKLLGLRRSPTILVAVASYMTGTIDWARATLSIDDVEKPWRTLRQHVVPRYKEEWIWNETKYTVYHSSEYEEWTVRVFSFFNYSIFRLLRRHGIHRFDQPMAGRMSGDWNSENQLLLSPFPPSWTTR